MVVESPYPNLRNQVDTANPRADRDRINQYTQAIIYARTSPRPQSTEASLAKQIDDCKARARERGLEVVDVVADDRKSGKGMSDRPRFQAALERACHERLVIVAYDLARVSRSMMDTFQIAEDLDSNGAAMITVSGPEIDTSSPMSKAVFRMAVIINEWFREQQGQLTKEALAWRRSQNMLTGPPPYGWSKGADGKVKPEPAQQRIIRWIIWRREKGASFGWIFRELIARGYGKLPSVEKRAKHMTRQWCGERYDQWREHFGVYRVELDWYDALVNYLIQQGQCWDMKSWQKKPPIVLHRRLVPDRKGDWPHPGSLAGLPAMDAAGRLCMPLADIRAAHERIWMRSDVVVGSPAWKLAQSKIILPATEEDVPAILRSGFQWRAAFD